MDKTVILAVAGSGKTTHIVNSLSREKRSLLITYTIANYENLYKKIIRKFDGEWPNNIVLMRYFPFLYGFCYKPFLSDIVKARGIIYEPNPNRYVSKGDKKFYITESGHLYYNRISLLLEVMHTIDDIKDRIATYFDELIIDEVQDIAGRDFDFLERIMESNVNQLFVGDFYQHTFDTSRDGNVNANLFESKRKYEKRFTDKGFICDNNTLMNSWRCNPIICKFIRDNLGIEMYSNRSFTGNERITILSDPAQKKLIVDNPDIVKLHYQKAASFGDGHYNWGEIKGQDHYNDVCIYMNKTSAKAFFDGKLSMLKPATRNKLYVAITRAHGNVYFTIE